MTLNFQPNQLPFPCNFLTVHLARLPLLSLPLPHPAHHAGLWHAMLVDELHPHSPLEAFAQGVEPVKAVKEQLAAANGHKAVPIVHWHPMLPKVLLLHLHVTHLGALLAHLSLKEAGTLLQRAREGGEGVKVGARVCYCGATALASCASHMMG